MKTLQQEITPPQVAIGQLSVESGSLPGQWMVVWAVKNLSSHPLRLLRARLPHSLFYRPEQELTPPREVKPGESGHLEFVVSCREPPGTVIENAFLILQAVSLQQSWWIFTRLRVVLEDRGPRAAAESVTIHPVGFSR